MIEDYLLNFKYTNLEIIFLQEDMYDRELSPNIYKNTKKHCRDVEKKKVKVTWIRIN